MKMPVLSREESEALRALLRARQIRYVREEFVLLMLGRELMLLETRVDGPREIRVLNLATEKLGSFERARDWLARPDPGLGGVSPFALLGTDEGARRVEEVLERSQGEPAVGVADGAK